MFNLPVLAGIGTLLLAIGGFGGYKVASNHYIAKLALEQAVAQQQYETRVYEVDVIAGELEKVKNERAILSREIAGRLDEIIDRPSYATVCIDNDGVRLINDTIEGSTDSAKSPARVPTPPASERR